MRHFFKISGLLAAAIFSQQLSAHAHLKEQYPAADAVVDASAQALRLTFSEDIEPAFSGVDVMRTDRQRVTLAQAQRDGNRKNQLIIPLQEPLTRGTYQVNWHVLSVDGHKTSGNYRFSVK